MLDLYSFVANEKNMRIQMQTNINNQPSICSKFDLYCMYETLKYETPYKANCQSDMST